MMKNLTDVQRYWDEFPCGIQVTDKDLGTPEFFDEIKRKFHDTYNTYSHSDELLNFQAYRRKSVLEAGCGIGIDALEFARYGAVATAIDLSPKNIKLARQYFAHHNLRATIEVGNLEELPFTDDTFDLAVAIGVSYYTPNTEKGVNELWRVLKLGGKAICMFYNRYSWYVLLAILSRTNVDHTQGDARNQGLFSNGDKTDV